MPRGGLREVIDRSHPRGASADTPLPRVAAHTATARHRSAVRMVMERAISPLVIEQILHFMIGMAMKPEGFKDRELLLKYSAGVPSVSTETSIAELSADEVAQLAEQVMDALPVVEVTVAQST